MSAKRRFRVWGGCTHSQCPNKDEAVLEFDDDVPDADIESDCDDAVDELMGQHACGGWEELKVQP